MASTKPAVPVNSSPAVRARAGGRLISVLRAGDRPHRFDYETFLKRAQIVFLRACVESGKHLNESEKYGESEQILF